MQELRTAIHEFLQPADPSACPQLNPYDIDSDNSATILDVRALEGIQATYEVYFIIAFIEARLYRRSAMRNSALAGVYDAGKPHADIKRVVPNGERRSAATPLRFASDKLEERGHLGAEDIRRSERLFVDKLPTFTVDIITPSDSRQPSYLRPNSNLQRAHAVVSHYLERLDGLSGSAAFRDLPEVDRAQISEDLVLLRSFEKNLVTMITTQALFAKTAFRKLVGSFTSVIGSIKFMLGRLPRDLDLAIFPVLPGEYPGTGMERGDVLASAKRSISKIVSRKNSKSLQVALVDPLIELAADMDTLPGRSVVHSVCWSCSMCRHCTTIVNLFNKPIRATILVCLSTLPWRSLPLPMV